MTHHFDYAESAAALLTPRTINLLTAIHEAKGRQTVQAAFRPDILDTLVTVARIQSTSASNRIEGISTSDKRLNALVEEKTSPRNRDEEEIAGYRDVLATIHDSHDYIPLTPNVILQLHRDLFRHTPLTFGGRFKDTDNVIIERDITGQRSVRFTPPSALITPELVASACTAHNEAVGQNAVDPLIAMAMFIFDFTCIHPFNDGNGRMSRLLTLLLLYRSGYTVGKYISVEHLIELSKDTYYDALAASTSEWNENDNDYAPFVNYLLGTVLLAYKEFDERVGMAIDGARVGNGGTTDDVPRSNMAPGASAGTPIRPTKERRIALLFDDSLSPLSKADIAQRMPDTSISTIERTLKKLLDDGVIIKIGSGRATRYIRKR